MFDERLWDEIESVSHREYGTGFYFSPVGGDASVCSGPGYIRDKAYLAVAEAQNIAPPADKRDGSALYRFTQRNKFSRGDTVSLVTPGKVGQSFKVIKLYGSDGSEIEATPHPSMEFWHWTCRSR